MLKEAPEISRPVALESEEVPRFYCGCLCHVSPEISTIEKLRQFQILFKCQPSWPPSWSPSWPPLQVITKTGFLWLNFKYFLPVCRLIQVSLGIYRVLYTFFLPAEFPGYHQCQQESQ